MPGIRNQGEEAETLGDVEDEKACRLRGWVVQFSPRRAVQAFPICKVQGTSQQPVGAQVRR